MRAPALPRHPSARAGIIAAHGDGVAARRGGAKEKARRRRAERVCDSNRAGKATARYGPMVRTTLFFGRLLFDDSLSSWLTISSYLGTVVSCPFGTICTTL